jgi:signal peptidase II
MRLLLIAVLLLYYYRAERAYRYALALIIAGALGNVLDIFFYGHVVDMFHFVLWGYQYPVFNVADSSIFCGVLLYIVLSWKQNYAGNKVA